MHKKKKTVNINLLQVFSSLETALGVLLTDLYHKGLITLDTLVSRMSYMPGKLFFDGSGI